MKKFFLSLSLATLPLRVFAQDGGGDPVPDIGRAPGVDRMWQFINNTLPRGSGVLAPLDIALRVVVFVRSAVVAIAILMIVILGLRLLISGGQQQTVDESKKGIMYVLVGVVAAFTAEIAIRFVQAFF